MPTRQCQEHSKLLYPQHSQDLKPAYDRTANMAVWSMQKRMKVAGLLILSATLFYLAFTIDRVEGKVFEHTNVVQLDATSFDEKVGNSTPSMGFLKCCLLDRDQSFTQLCMSFDLFAVLISSCFCCCTC